MRPPFFLLGLAIVALASHASAAGTCPTGTRNVSFMNNCGETIWVGAVGNRTKTVAGADTCAADKDCAVNQYCDATITHQCTFMPVNGTVSTTSTACTMNGDCPAGQFCYTATATCASLPADGNGWQLTAGQNEAVCVPQPWAGRFWSRTTCTFSGTVCSSGTQCCDTGSCLGEDDKTFSLYCRLSAVPPATLAEVALLAYPTDDTYDVSNVDGFNTPVAIAPVGGTYQTTPPPGTFYTPWCGSPGCAKDCGTQPTCNWNLSATTCPTQMLYVVPKQCTTNADCPTPTSKCNAAGICTCCSATDCAAGQVCGVSPLNGGTQTCGTYAGCYSANAACSADPHLGAPLDCQTNAALYACTGSTYGNSCYTAGATPECCGCPSWSPTNTCQSSNSSWVTLAETTALPPSPIGFAATFHDACPTAYSYQFDDKVSTFNCLGQNVTTPVAYAVTFCSTISTSSPPQCISDASCGDGNICNGVETCRAGICTVGTPLDCDDGDPCTMDSCAPASGCQHTTVADLGSCSTVIPGGQNKKSDCYVFADLKGMHPIENQKTLVCSDGDPTCDMDGKCNNVCVLQARLCINSATLPPCTPPSQLTTLKFKSHPKSFALNTPAQLTGPQCSAFNTINLPVKVSKKGKKSTGVLKVTATAKAPKPTKPKSDSDTYIMKCVPGCAPS
jgi:hypothetical protein